MQEGFLNPGLTLLFATWTWIACIWDSSLQTWGWKWLTLQWSKTPTWNVLQYSSSCWKMTCVYNCLYIQLNIRMFLVSFSPKSPLRQGRSSHGVRGAIAACRRAEQWQWVLQLWADNREGREDAEMRNSAPGFVSVCQWVGLHHKIELYDFAAEWKGVAMYHKNLMKPWLDRWGYALVKIR